MARALEGKVSIVTGGGQGLGRAHCLRLAAEGASVVVTDVGDAAHEVAEEITTLGGSALAIRSSASDFEGAADVFATTRETFGDVHVIVNNAGILRDAMPFNMDEAQWDAVIDVHLKGHFCLTRHALAWWREQNKAGVATQRRIINTTSEAGLFGSPGQLNYAAAKGGIVAMTLSLARVAERLNTTVNTIAPRARTPMTANQALFTKKEGWGDTMVDPYDPDNTSRVIAWLASDGASEVNGQVFITQGAQLFLCDVFPIVGEVQQDRAWEVADLDAAKKELFGSRSSGVPAWGGPTWA